MRKYVIERSVSGIGGLSAEQLSGVAAKSNAALAEIGTDVQWVESYVAADKTFCVYLAKDEAVVKRHAQLSGFPADRITEIKTMIDPTAAG